MGLLSDDEDEEEYASDNSEARSRGSSNSKVGEQSDPVEVDGVGRSLAAAASPRRRQDGGDGGGGSGRSSGRGSDGADEADDGSGDGCDGGGGEKLPNKRESVFTAGSRWDRRSSQVANDPTSMPEIPIRRRTRVAADSSSPPPSAQVGAVARASRIITELELEQGVMRFPLDSLRGGSSGIEDDEDDEGDEDESAAAG